MKKTLARSPLGAGLTATLLTALAACSGSGSGSEASSPCAGISRNTPNYVWEAVNPNQFFRWTKYQNESYVLLRIEVDDVNVPAGFDASERKADLIWAREKLKAVIQSGGVSIASQTRWLSSSSGHSSSKAKLVVRYVDTLSNGKLGLSLPDIQGSEYREGEVRLASRRPSGTALTRNELRTILLHELAHAIGISGLNSSYPGHSPRMGDVLFATACPFQDYSTGDRAALQTLYQHTPHFSVKGY